MRFPPLAILSLCVLAFVGTATAHPVDAGAGLAAGFAHPLGGLDHVLAMVAVGLWAAQLGGRALWLVPSAFVAMMLAGGALGAAGVGVPAVEIGVAGSVLLLGLLIAFGVRAPLGVSMALVGGFAILHGHAHGSAMPAGAGALYVLGFTAATVILHAVGVGLGVTCGTRWTLRWGGVGIAAAGIALILTA
jgi:urease accessory protein